MYRSFISPLLTAILISFMAASDALFAVDLTKLAISNKLSDSLTDAMLVMLMATYVALICLNLCAMTDKIKYEKEMKTSNFITCILVLSSMAIV